MAVRYKAVICALLLIATSACAGRAKPFITPGDVPPKQYPLVLVHGLLNKHRWGPAFLDACLKVWGSGNVYIVYTNPSERIWVKTVNGRSATCIGGDDHTAGTGTIEAQADLLERAIAKLQAESSLGRRFDIIAHSMGGLVSRCYIGRHPDAVAGLVTLGTPHHGSPLADSFKWASRFLGATDAVGDLQPSVVAAFNQSHPAASARLYDRGRIYTIRGNCPDGDCHGWGGELGFGWEILKRFHHTDSDGLVPQASAVLEGAEHIADFPEFDHYELVLEPSVALAAAKRLP